jgi:hypothetical protein
MQNARRKNCDALMRGRDDDIGVQGLSAGNPQYDRAEDQCAAKSVPKKER